MVIAIINPEGIALFAFRQYMSAQELKQQWDEHFNGDGEVNKKRRGSFTMEVAFFIVMGGFTIDESTEESDRPICSKHTLRLCKLGIIHSPGAEERKKSKFTATLTPAGFIKYLSEGWFDNYEFKNREIRDKGKTSNIAKILSASQALWLVVQCVARKASRLPLRYAN
jgi:hypothetical protein